MPKRQYLLALICYLPIPVVIVAGAARTGTPAADIVAQQAASSGMWAAGEGMVELYLVTLFYLLWPVLFDLAGALVQSRSAPPSDTPRAS